MVTLSALIRTSLTSNRSTRRRSSVVEVSALSWSWDRNPCKVGGQGEVGVAVGELGVQGVDLVAQAGFAGAQ
ncbi:hypothetical protein, partial [Nocardia sp. GAS34]|uniref:hypothetical protein n=1 Tax=Nocardia sp. GAS34 TaxID=3156305 RepID=UPI003D25936A